jgi:LysR family transcriptional regulator, low CO2-responsive transcriptional regulator
MDFDQLLTFLEVAKLGNFSRAGEKVYRSQSAVSAQIRQLEQEYGERLFDRSGKTVRLSPAGDVLLEYAQRMVALRNESLRAVADQGETPRGTLSIGANEATCLYVLPEIFTEYCQHFPQVQISVYRNFSRKILQAVEDGVIDVGIATMPVKSPSLKVHAIFRDQLMLFVSTHHPLASHESVSVDEIANYPLIFPKTGYTRQQLDKLFRPYNSRLRVAMEIPSVGLIKSFVVSGVGISLLSSSFAQDEVRAGKAKLLPIKNVELWRELGLVYRTDRTLPRAATAFIDLIRHRTVAKKSALKSHRV